MPGVCSIDGCVLPVNGRGWCAKHYWRWRKYGDASRPTAQDLTTEERFWRFVDKSGSCWLWTGHKNRTGYGTFKLCRPTSVAAHRFSYEISNGPIPEGMFIMHSCDVPACVNPDHLSAGTPADNTADSVRKGRNVRGEQVGTHKLTSDEVLEMRRRYSEGGVSKAALSRDYGVSDVRVSAIISRKAWKHI